jgi:hypothetical protein
MDLFLSFFFAVFLRKEKSGASLLERILAFFYSEEERGV